MIQRVMRVRDPKGEPFCFIKTFPNSRFTFLNVKATIENAEASVLDVTPDGSTILEVSDDFRNHESRKAS